MAYRTNAMLLAALEAKDCELRSEKDDHQRARVALQELRLDHENMTVQLSHYMGLAHAAKVDEEVITFNSLQARAKRLSALGIPVTLHRGHVLHSRTRAVVQPGSYGEGT